MFIEFRAKNAIKNTWKYGFVIIIDNDHCMIYKESIIVCKTSTLGQYTNINDITSTKIYKGDLLQSQVGDMHVWQVDWNNGSWCIYRKDEKKRKYKHQEELFDCDNVEFYKLKWIGTIYDNANLLTIKHL